MNFCIECGGKDGDHKPDCSMRLRFNNLNEHQKQLVSLQQKINNCHRLLRKVLISDYEEALVDIETLKEIEELLGTTGAELHGE